MLRSPKGWILEQPEGAGFPSPAQFTPRSAGGGHAPGVARILCGDFGRLASFRKDRNLIGTDAEASYVHVFIGGDPRWDSSLPMAAVSVTPL